MCPQLTLCDFNACNHSKGDRRYCGISKRVLVVSCNHQPILRIRPDSLSHTLIFEYWNKTGNSWKTKYSLHINMFIGFGCNLLILPVFFSKICICHHCQIKKKKSMCHYAIYIYYKIKWQIQHFNEWINRAYRMVSNFKRHLLNCHHSHHLFIKCTNRFFWSY